MAAWAIPCLYARTVDATLAWTVVGSVAGVAGASAAIVFGAIPFAQARRKDPGQPDSRSSASGAAGVRLPAPVLAVQVRGREDVIATLLGLASGWGAVLHWPVVTHGRAR
jgi:hypothetical protein